MAILPENRRKNRVKSIQTVEYFDNDAVDGVLRTVTKYFLVILVGVALGYFWAAQAYGADGILRCGTVIIEPGDSMERVEHYCGAPDRIIIWGRNAYDGGIVPRQYNGTLTMTASRWVTEFYYRGNLAFDRWLLFKDDVLVGILED